VKPRVTPAKPTDVVELADVAARTFPLACPAAATADNIAAFIAANLSAECFAGYLADPDRAVYVAREDRPILGYAMLIRGVPDDPDVARAVTAAPAVELSKIYVLPESHGGAVSAALIEAAVSYARELRARCVWLGVNQENQRAQRFYTKHGFTVSGTKTFRLGAGVEHDYVMVRRLS
jgi:ribosomal protein S18 acetylase RimI-like enzyme